MNWTAEKTSQVKELITKQIISLESLVKKALKFKGLEFGQLSSICCSKPFSTHKIEGVFLANLKKWGFRLNPRPDKIITLSANVPIEIEAGIERINFWNFPEGKDLELNLGVYVDHGPWRRGLILRPDVSGRGISAASHLAQAQVFAAAAEVIPDLHPIVREIVDGGGKTQVLWSDLGLGGLRRIDKLFNEFCGGNSTLVNLANSRVCHFSFDPLGREERYLSEPYQPALLDLWQMEREEYKNRL